MGIFDKHHHQWAVTGKRFHQPRSNLRRVDNIDAPFSDDLRMAIFGFTTVSYKCETCGRLEVDHLVGEHTE